MKDIKEVAHIVAVTADYYQLPVDEILQWIKDSIIDLSDDNCYHYEVKKD